jgi:hypothetical protein
MSKDERKQWPYQRWKRKGGSAPEDRPPLIGPRRGFYQCSCCHRQQFVKSELLNLQPNWRSWQGSFILVCFDCVQGVRTVRSPDAKPPVVDVLRGVWDPDTSAGPVVVDHERNWGTSHERSWCTAWEPGTKTPVIAVPAPKFECDCWWETALFEGSRDVAEAAFKKDFMFMLV